MQISDFLIKIGIIANTEVLDKVTIGIGALTKKATLAAAAIATANGGLSAFVKTSLEELDSIAQLSRETGVASETIQELGRVAETNGGSMESAMDTVKDLSRTIGQAANGFSDGAGAFKDWGLSAKKANGQVKTVGEMIEEIQKKMQKLSKSQQQALLDDLNIDPKMLQTFRLTNKEWAEAQKIAKAMSLGTATKEGVDTAAAFMDGLTQIGQMIKAVSQYIALSVAPVITEFTGKIRDWFVNNNKMIKDSLTTFANKLKFAVKFVGKLADAIDTVVENTIGWKATLIAIGVVMAIINAASLPIIIQWTAIAAAIIVVIAIIEDFIRAWKGKSSLLGKAWQPLIDFLKEVINYFNILKNALSNAHFFDDFVAGVKSYFSAIKQFFSGLWSAIKGILTIIEGAFTLNDDLVKQGLKNLFGGVIDMVEGTGKMLLNTFSTFLKLLRDMFFAVGDIIGSPFKKAFESVAKMARKFLPKSVVDFLGLGEEHYPDEKKDDKDKTKTESKKTNTTEKHTENVKNVKNFENHKRENVKNVENTKNIETKKSHFSIKEKFKNLEKIKHVTEKVTHKIGTVAGGAVKSLSDSGINANSLKKMSVSVPNLSKTAKAGVINQGAVSKVMNNNTNIDVKVNASGNPTQIGRAVADSIGQSIANTQSKQKL